MNPKLKITLALAAVLAVTASVGLATGAIPSTNDGTINTCIASFNGTKYLRPIDKQAGEKCKTGEKALAWNQKGIPGPQGPRGATGPAGPKGSGVGTITPVVGSESLAAGQTGKVEVDCPANAQVTGGGFLTADDDPDLNVTTSSMTSDHRGWFVIVENSTGETQSAFAEVICAK